jgi:predicted metal-dependent phosphoesterase TrpH
MFADLHLHTRYSDGTYTPEELVRQAKRQGLALIALTDHDTVEGCDPTAIFSATTWTPTTPGCWRRCASSRKCARAGCGRW